MNVQWHGSRAPVVELESPTAALLSCENRANVLTQRSAAAFPCHTDLRGVSPLSGTRSPASGEFNRHQTKRFRTRPGTRAKRVLRAGHISHLRSSDSSIQVTWRVVGAASRTPRSACPGRRLPGSGRVCQPNVYILREFRSSRSLGWPISCKPVRSALAPRPRPSGPRGSQLAR